MRTQSFCLVALLSTGLASAQQAKPQTPPPAPAPTAAKEPDYVTTREFKSRLFLIQHRSPSSLRDVLRPLMSGFRGAAMDATERDGLNTISVRDFPENIAAIEEAIKRLDVPGTRRTVPEVELRIQVLFAHKGAAAPGEPLPESLQPVVKSLKSTLAYKSYTLAGSYVQRAIAGTWNASGGGDLEAPAVPGKSPLTCSWRMSRLRADQPAEGPTTFTLENFSMRPSRGPSIDTSLTIKDGETVVVGTSSLEDKGLIVVVSAKVIK